jgi:hypothetical protein
MVSLSPWMRGFVTLGRAGVGRHIEGSLSRVIASVVSLRREAAVRLQSTASSAICWCLDGRARQNRHLPDCNVSEAAPAATVPLLRPKPRHLIVPARFLKIQDRTPAGKPCAATVPCAHSLPSSAIPVQPHKYARIRANSMNNGGSNHENLPGK